MNINTRLGLAETVETLLGQERRMSQVSNNLANVDTAGYKKDSVTFWERLHNAASGRQRVGKTVKPLTSHNQGANELTGRPLDLAINGDGFFKIQTPQGVRYTRAGNFQINGQGRMLTGNGDPVLGLGGEIVLTGNEVTFDLNGRVMSDGVAVNQLAIVTFENLDDLEKEGANLFRVKEQAVQELEADRFELQQGFLESSNVSTVAEMTEMMDLLRNYETQQKVIRTLDEVDAQAIGRVGKLTG